jgi:glycosyltransferase involved in cell wall biosynthesis
LKLSIIIPVYNEYENIDLVIQTVRSAGLPPEIQDLELILVDDGSVDGTAQKLEKYHDGRTVIVHSSGSNSGKGTAIRTGITYVTGDIVLIQDADMEYDPNDYVALLQPLISGRAAVVYGSRFLRKWWPEGMAWQNWLANQLLKITTNILYGAGLTDEATAYKMFKTDILRSLNLKAKRFELCPELTAKILKKGHKITEVPINYKGRTVAEGKKIKWHDGFESIWALLKYRFVD